MTTCFYSNLGKYKWFYIESIRSSLRAFHVCAALSAGGDLWGGAAGRSPGQSSLRLFGLWVSSLLLRAVWRRDQWEPAQLSGTTLHSLPAALQRIHSELGAQATTGLTDVSTLDLRNNVLFDLGVEDILVKPNANRKRKKIIQQSLKIGTKVSDGSSNFD